MRWIRRLSIRWRITLGSLLVAVVLLTGALLVFRGQVQHILVTTTTTVLTHDAAPYLAQVAAGSTESFDIPVRGQLVAVVDSGQTVQESSLPRSLRKKLPAILDLPDGVHTVIGGDDAYRLLVQTVVTDEGDWTVVSARNEDSSILSLGRITTALVIGAGVLVLGFGVAAWLLTSAALRPVNRMRRQAEAIVAEGSREPLPLGRARDELFALGTTLNEFISDVRGSVERERQLVSDASHELRTPLAILVTQLELAHLSSGDAAALEAQITTAQHSAERLSVLATGLLELSQLEAHAGDIPPVALWPQLVDELAAAVDRARMLAVGKGVTVDFDASETSEPEDSGYRITVSNFGRLITNLTSNSIAAVPHGGRIRIALRRSPSELILTVVDSGPGMPEAFLPLAFDRFSRPDDSRADDSRAAGAVATNGGSGLGLAIVQAIVSSAQGSVTLSNAAGFTVTVSLPSVG